VKRKNQWTTFVDVIYKIVVLGHANLNVAWALQSVAIDTLKISQLNFAENESLLLCQNQCILNVTFD
jgi:hypothetical protein